MNSVLKATSREFCSSSGLIAMRKEQIVPGVIYEKGQDSIMFAVEYIALEKLMRQGCFFNTIIDLELDGKSISVLPKAVQSHTVTDRVIHLEVQKVSKEDVVDVVIPVQIVGRDASETLKRGGSVNAVLKGVKVRCKSGSIPRAVRLDVSNLKIGNAIRIRDLKLPGEMRLLQDGSVPVLTITGKNKDKLAIEASENAKA